METSEWIHLYMGTVLAMLIWREWLKARFDKMRDPKTLAGKLEQEQADRVRQARARLQTSH